MGKNPLLTRRNFLKGFAGAGLFAAIGGPTYSFGVERNWLQTTHTRIPIFQDTPKHPFQGTRIAHLTDIHYGHFWHRKQLESLIQQVKALKPDMICFTGDLIDSELGDLMDQVDLMQELAAPLGCYAVLGNHDVRGLIPQLQSFWTRSGFRLLINEHLVLEQGQSRLVIAGVDDALSGDADLAAALKGVSLDDTVLLLAHEPDFADIAERYPPIKLQLSGHSHGGQIRLPFAGAVFTPAYGKKYVAGHYVTSNQMHVYTSRGIGTTMMPLRFLCRPELALIELI